MKKTVIVSWTFLVLIALHPFVIIKCDSDSNSEIEKIDSEIRYLNTVEDIQFYIKGKCAEHNFDAARRATDKLEKLVNEDINSKTEKIKEIQDVIATKRGRIEEIKASRFTSKGKRFALEEEVKGHLLEIETLTYEINGLQRIDNGLLFVNEQEIYYLLASNSRDDANRVMYLYNTYEKEQLPDMSDVLEVAISQGNEYLAEKLITAGVKQH